MEPAQNILVFARVKPAPLPELPPLANVLSPSARGNALLSPRGARKAPASTPGAKVRAGGGAREGRMCGGQGRAVFARSRSSRSR